MKKGVSVFAALVLFLNLMTGCGGRQTAETDNSFAGSASSGSVSAPVEVDFSQTDAEMFTDRDFETEYDETDGVLIELNGSSASASSDNVRISGTTVTITEEAVYIISGSLDDGMIIVDAPDTAKPRLVLNGVDINSADSAALYILEADKVFVTLAEGSQNTLSNDGSFTAIDENNIDSVIFSKQDLTLNGSGTLTVTSPAGHGIVSKDDLAVTGGTYLITSAAHGVDANDSIRITGKTSVTVDAGKDGIHAENNEDASLGFVYISDGTIHIESEGDGISAGSYMQIENGTFQILAGGGSENGTKESSDSWGGFRGGFGGGRPGQSSFAEETAADDGTSMKGLKSASGMLISNGSFTVDSADDAVHSNTSIAVNGGSFEIASGDDAFHADEALTVTAGKILITESYEGMEALQVSIQGGDITLTARDDGLNAAGGTDASGISGGRDGMFGGRGGMASSDGSIAISGGTLNINASGDGIDANGTLTISGGYTVVSGPTQGDTATLDYDISGTITGGTFIGTGASGMAQTFSDSQQGVISVSLGNQSAGTAISLTDQNGGTIITYTPELSFQVVILSSPQIVSGEQYTITVGSVSSQVEAD